MAVSLDNFGKAFIAAGLMTADELKAVWNALPADARPKEGDAFAKLLVERGKLTAFQAAEILAGRGARLVMGEYLLLAEIGAGGMGQVYKARHKRMERVVALKVMSAAAMKDEAAVKRFQREVRAAARLEHPNIVTAYDSGDAAGVKYLVMQFVDGGDLSSLVKKGGPLAIDEAVDYVVQTAQGLAYAHGEGVIHRDIKPANLLLDKNGVVKILDMGLARIENGDDNLTATEQVMGTVDYMSPEQSANTKGVDARADIYSLGCTLWFLLTGKKLYDGDTMIARLMAHRDAPLPSLVKVRGDAPWPLEQALHKLIAKRAADRFQTMDDVIAALAPFGGSKASPSGTGSSIGMSAGPQDAELASFLKSVGPGAKPQAKPTPSKTKVDAEATAQFVAPDLETDPKSEILPLRRGTAGAKPQASRGTQSKQPPVKLIAAGVGAVAAIVVAGIVLLARNNEPGASATGGSTGIPSTANTPVAHAPGSTSLVADGSPEKPSFAELLDSPDYVWSEPENLGPNVNGPEDEHIISLTNDELRLYFRSKDTAGLARSYEAVRGSPAEPFGKSQFAQPMTTDAYVGGNGLTFVAIARAESNGHDLTIQHRPKLDAPWDKPVNLGAQVNSPIEDRRPTLSHDGLTLLFSTNRSAPSGLDLWISRRKSQVEPFGAATSVGPPVNTADAPVQCGVLLADGQTIVFRRGGMLHFTFTGQHGGRSTLPLRNHPFTAESLNALELWFAPDGRTAYFSATRPGGLGGKDIWVTRRVPKGSGSPTSPTSSFATNTEPPSFIALPTPPPPGDYALKFRVGAHVDFRQPNLDLVKPFTIEAFVTYPTDSANKGFAWVFNIKEHVLIQLDTVGSCRAHLYVPLAGARPTSITAAAPFPIGPRFHVAAVRTTSEFRLYLDGKLVKTAPLDADVVLNAPNPTAQFGGGTGPGGGFDGVLDEVRISQAERYTRDFTPAARHEPDADTLVLFHCDEGFGDVLKDSSGKGLDGTLLGPKWVRPDGSAPLTTGGSAPLTELRSGKSTAPSTPANNQRNGNPP